MLGSIFYGLTLLIVICFALFNASKPSLSGENGMGYGLGLAFFGLVFAISSFILTLTLGWKGGFNWVSNQSFNRIALVSLGWACMATATFACAAFRWEWSEGDFPQFLQWLGKSNGQFWLPLLMLIPYLFLMSPELKASVPPNVYKIPLIIGFVLAVIVSLSVLLGWLRITGKQQAAEIESRNERDVSIRKDHLQTIEKHKKTDNIVYLMALTGRFHDEDIRSAAVAKVREKSNWEDKLIELLEDKYYYKEAYTFLDGNTVEHPEKFLEPLNRSILHMANEIHLMIHDATNLQSWHFEPYSIDRLLRAIDEQFLDKGMDFRPAVLKLQEALKTTPPEQFKNVRFEVTPVVNDWLKRHK